VALVRQAVLATANVQLARVDHEGHRHDAAVVDHLAVATARNESQRGAAVDPATGNEHLEDRREVALVTRARTRIPRKLGAVQLELLVDRARVGALESELGAVERRPRKRRELLDDDAYRAAN